MFPIRDNIHSRSFPIVNWLLIILNVVVFFLEWSLSPEGLQEFINNFALTPAFVTLINPLSLLPFFTHMFLHGSWVHIISNVWILFIFGDNVEDRMGSLKYLVFYLAGGLAAAVLQFLLTNDPTIPMVGASGAIAAVMGAYFLYFPRARVHTFIPIFILPWFIQVPAVIYLGLWFVTQLFSGALALTPQAAAAGGGVAFWAHVGGFAFGLLVAGIFSGKKKARTYPDEYYPW